MSSKWVRAEEEAQVHLTSWPESKYTDSLKESCGLQTWDLGDVTHVTFDFPDLSIFAIIPSKHCKTVKLNFDLWLQRTNQFEPKWTFPQMFTQTFLKIAFTRMRRIDGQSKMAIVVRGSGPDGPEPLAKGEGFVFGMNVNMNCVCSRARAMGSRPDGSDLVIQTPSQQSRWQAAAWACPWPPPQKTSLSWWTGSLASGVTGMSQRITYPGIVSCHWARKTHNKY